MAKVIVAKDLPADEVDAMEETFKQLGATEIKRTEQEDGTFTLEGTFAT